MSKFLVTFTESSGKTMTQTCDVPSKEDVIKIYGLNESDILNYKIEQYGSELSF